MTAVRKVLHDLFTWCVGRAQWANYKMDLKVFLFDSLPRFRDVIPRAGRLSFGMSLLSFAYVKMNLLRTGVDRFCLCVH